MKPRPRQRIETPQQLRRAIISLSPASPITDRFTARWRKLGQDGGGQIEQAEVWYKTQHEHWVGWLQGYGGPGAYNRKNADRSAGFVYNHIVNPQMLVYLAEAARVDPALLTKATKAALSNRVSMASMSSAIRRIIPWPIVEQALRVRPEPRLLLKHNSPPKIETARWTPSLLKLPVLSIRQPFAWLVVNGIKDIENRSWRTHYRGPLLVHAGASSSYLTPDIAEICETKGGVRLPEDFEQGGVIGYVEVVDCVRRHSSVWKHGPSWGWVLANARPLKFRECRGSVGYFYPKW